MTTLESSRTQVPTQTVPPARRGGVWRGANAVAAIAYRDFLKLIRDPARLFSTFVFPLIFIGFLGSGMQAAFGGNMGFNYLVFVFTGVLAQTLFQSTAQGIVSLLEDRLNDFSQEIFVSPVSRYLIIFGKIMGETLVALPQGLGILVFAFVLGVPMTPAQAVAMVLVGFVTSLYGGAFGMLILGALPNRRALEQIFPFVFLPQFFTAGVFTPINNLPPLLNLVSLLSPMRYVVDLTRGVFYWGTPDYGKVVLAPPIVNLAVIAASFILFMAVGTVLFVRAERNK